jgi:hypothetical protein
MKKLLGNLTVMIGLDLFYALIIFIIWNTAAVWVVPQLHSMTYWNGLGLATLFLLIDFLAKYWTGRILSIRQLKAMEKAMNTDKLALDLLELKVQLKEKNIL